MARPIEFDPAAALDAAMDLFWRQGFRRASLTDLSAAMGLSRSSFYQSFRSKQKVLEAAIDRYAEMQAARLAELSRKRPLRVALARIFEAIAHDNNAGRGCLLGNCAVELGPHDPAIAERVRRGMAAQASVFEGMIRTAQARGEIDACRSSEELAYYMATTITGMRVLAKTGIPPGLLVKIGDAALQNVFEPAKEARPKRS
jgi:TetR/AcrR family transcriptional repressor of nem operon